MFTITQDESKIREWYKNKESDSIWWTTSPHVGEFLFSFDKRKIYNMFQDYPMKLSKSEQALFAKENPYWRRFFADRFGGK